jgi:hypothetical protein
MTLGLRPFSEENIPKPKASLKRPFWYGEKLIFEG